MFIEGDKQMAAMAVMLKYFMNIASLIPLDLVYK